MSTQTGITAAPSLLLAFKELRRSQPFLVRISEDSTQLVHVLEFEVEDAPLEELLAQTKAFLEASYPEPAYIIAPTHVEGSEDQFFASYIPDAAPIRAKMLYAATKNSALQQLGASFNKNHVFSWTGPEDITIESYYKDIDTSQKPLTEEEVLLQQMNSLHTSEQAAFSRKLASMHDTGSLLGPLSTLSPLSGAGVLFSVDERAESALSSLDDQLLVFQIDISSETVNLSDSKSSVPISDLIRDLSGLQIGQLKPLYALYRYKEGNFAFIYACPSGSKVKERMLYATSKRSFQDHIKAAVAKKDGEVNKNLEVGDLDELDVNELKEQTETVDTLKLKFSKPKGPRRR